MIDTFYREKSGELVRFCEVILHHRTIGGVDAEDIVQRVVVKACEKQNQLAEHPNLMGWFLNACVKECGMLMREGRYQQKHLGWSVPLADDIAMEEQQDAILRWLNHMEAVEFLDELVSELTPLEKSVYDLYYIQERSAKDTASALDLKVNAVNDAARRIRKRATAVKNSIFIFFISPILALIRSILSEGRLWK